MAQLTEAEIARRQTQLIAAEDALDNLLLGFQERSVAHGDAASNSSVTYQGVSEASLRRRIDELRGEIATGRAASYAHKPIRLCG